MMARIRMIVQAANAPIEPLVRVGVLRVVALSEQMAHGVDRNIISMENSQTRMLMAVGDLSALAPAGVIIGVERLAPA